MSTAAAIALALAVLPMSLAVLIVAVRRQLARIDVKAGRIEARVVSIDHAVNNVTPGTPPLTDRVESIANVQRLHVSQLTAIIKKQQHHAEQLDAIVERLDDLNPGEPS